MPREFKVRQVKSREERKRPSVFMSLKTDQQFVAHAMFEPDPELDDNPGYFEYYVHNDQSIKQYVPCAGEDCPFCKVNDNPWTRALTVWYYPENAVGEQFKVFGINYKTINLLADEAEDEGSLLGRKMRIKRLSDKGDYTVRARADKAIGKVELKRLLPQVEELGLKSMIERQLQAHMERIAAMEMLEDDEEETDDGEDVVAAPPRRQGRAVVEEEEEADAEEAVEEEEDEEESEPEAEAEEEEEEDAETPTVEGEFPIVSFSEENETVTLQALGKRTKMYVGEGVDVDYDSLGAGVLVNLQAAQDDDEDWVITEFEIATASADGDEEEEDESPRPKRRIRRAK
jgi:hypothetical protein